MGRRKGPSLTRPQVVAAGVAVVCAEGADALGVSRVARELGIKPPSIYNYVDSGDELIRAVVIEANRQILEAFKDALRGVFNPSEQLRTLARTTRQWALEHGELYALMGRVEPNNDDPEFAPILRDMLDLFARPFGQLGVPPQEHVHAIRGLRAAVHGFVLLENSGQFQLADNREASYDWLVEAVLRGSARPSATDVP